MIHQLLKSLVAVSLFVGCSTASVREAAAPVPSQLQSTRDPSVLYGELFVKVQTAPVYSDSKYFVDMKPHVAAVEIVQHFQKEKPQTTPELKAFVDRNFLPPDQPADEKETSARSASVDLHIQSLWKHLTRQPDHGVSADSSLIPLPFPYVVPGGRFREIYYWDSYFTQLGLLADNQDELFKNMVQNFDYLLRTYGRIPNGNRDYYMGRSQPPFFALMIALWRDRYGDASALPFLPALRKEHDFWMQGNRAVEVADGKKLNRYWDDGNTPRPEAYKEDLELMNRADEVFKRVAPEVARQLRAGAESGWDYSTRWFADPKEFATIQTTAFAPVDLNSLLYFLEVTLADLYKISGENASGDKALSDKASSYLADSEKFRAAAAQRRALIQELMWDENSGTFRDYNWREKVRSAELTAATFAPLFTGVATSDQAKRLAPAAEKQLLKPGGIVTSLRKSGQQWDAPNGWPPLQWMAYAGLKRYGHDALADKIRTRWLKLNEKVYRSTGKMMEKYNVVDLHLKAGGGEYPLQDGFGWTNGVYRAMRTPEKSLKHLGFGK